MDVEITLRCKPFTTFGAGVYRVLVESDGSVLVWDHISHHWTRMHSLSERTMRRARKAAKAVAS